MQRRRKRGLTSEAEQNTTDQFLPDESAIDPRSFAGEVRDRLNKLDQHVSSQYSAMAAYATIGKSDVETARQENQAGAERTRSMVIELIDRLRRECMETVAGVERRLGGGPESDSVRVASLEQQVAELSSALERSLTEQRDLAATVSSLVHDRMVHDGWLVNGNSAAQLSLR